MAYNTSILLSLIFLVLFHVSSAQLGQQTWWGIQQQGPLVPRLQAKSECRIEKLTARQPSERFEQEAGTIEFWDRNTAEFVCAGFEAVKYTIQPKGLLVPGYSNVPQVFYTVQGEAILGVVFPGCAETYETESQSRKDRRYRLNDRHQKLWRFQQGDVHVIPTGITHWIYNDGDTPLVTVILLDTSNTENQLDRNALKFHLAGNARQSQSQQGQKGQEGQEGQQGQEGQEGQKGKQGQEGQEGQKGKQGQESEQGQEGQEGQKGKQGQGGKQGQEGQKGKQGQEGQQGQESQQGQGQQEEAGNILQGFHEKIIADSFNIEIKTAKKVQGKQDRSKNPRGFIVRAENLELVLPEQDQQQEQQQEQQGGQQQQGGQGGHNGLEETLCTMKLVHNIASPKQADVYNPRGGRISSLNSQKFPILNHLRLSVERGVLYKNAMVAPHWIVNAHSAVYITRGNGQIQVVGDLGRSVFNDQVKEGQLIVVPQNFAVVKKAGSEGLEWVAFKTNDNAIISPLAGRFSVIRGLPEDILVNSYQISREEARNLKSNKKEGIVFSPGSRTQGGGGVFYA